MTLPEHTPPLALLEEAVTVLFCRIDWATGSAGAGYTAQIAFEAL
jgi:hypothetical protein